MDRTRASLEGLRKVHNELGQAAAPARDVATDTTRTDFRSHPAFQQIQVAKDAAEVLGLESPFFRTTEAIEGTRVRIAGRWIENFASYDYLSLNADPRLAEAIDENVSRFGVSARASRIVGGQLGIHASFEQDLARFLGTEDALVTVSGHATNGAIVRTFMAPGDVVLLDALAHNSLFEGVRASGAAHITVPHNDTAWLGNWLERHRDDYNRALIAVEGLYSMDGDTPDIAALIELKERHDSWLLVDEAHSIGVLGQTGRGLSEHAAIDPGRIDLIMGTLSKSLCSCGGFIAGAKDPLSIMRHSAPGFVYSVGLSVPNAASAREALRILQSEPGRVARLSARSAFFRDRLAEAGLDTGMSQGFAVVPVIIGDSARAAWVSNRLFEDEMNVLPILAPAVPNRSARLRFFINADHSEEQLAEAAALTSRRVAEVEDVTF